MGEDSAAAVQAGVYQHLTANTALMGHLAGGVFDAPPSAGADFPYLVIGEGASRPIHAPGGGGAEHELVLHAYSRGQGMKESQGILSALRDALHGADFAVAGHVLLLCVQLTAEARAEGDGRTRRATARFRIATMRA